MDQTPSRLLATETDLLNLKQKVREINEFLESRDFCFYCGAGSYAEDHVIPHSFVSAVGGKRTGWEVDTLPACQSCNTCLHSKIFGSLEARTRYLWTAVNRKNQRLLREVVWHPSEIAELAPKLRGVVNERILQSDWVKGRLKNLSRDNCEIPAAPL